MDIKQTAFGKTKQIVCSKNNAVLLQFLKLLHIYADTIIKQNDKHIGCIL